MNSPARRMDAMRAAAGRAHRDVVRTGTRGAELYGGTDRTQRRWMDSGPPAAVEFDRFLSESPDPWRWRAHVEATAKMQTLDKLSDRLLIERVHDLRGSQVDLEGQDRMQDVLGAPLAERAVTKERLSACTAELSAALLLCAARGITESEALG